MSADQLGGQKGCGTSHYLALLVNYIYNGLDQASGTTAVAAMCVDLSKAFNRMDHSKLVTILYDMGVPVCALRLLSSYLHNRKMRLHLNGNTSDVFELFGGGPEGGLLTVILFNIYSNWLPNICQPGVPTTIGS